MWTFTPAEKYAVTLTSAHTLIKLPVGMTEQLTYSYMLSLSTGETPFSFTSPTLPPAFSSLNHSFPHPSELSLCCNTPNKCRPLELSLLLFLPREALKSFEICHSSLHVFSACLCFWVQFFTGFPLLSVLQLNTMQVSLYWQINTVFQPQLNSNWAHFQQNKFS